LNPASRGQGVSHASVAVNGSNFVATPTVAFSGTGITVHSVTRNSAVLLTLDLSVDGAAATGARAVTVTNPDGGSVTSAAAFTVNSKPSTTSANPNSMVQGATGTVTLTGTNYVATPTVSFSGTGIAVNNVTRDSLVQLTVNVTIAGGASTGARNVTVTNPDGGTSTANGIFTVTGLNDPLVYQTFGDPIIGSPAIESSAPNTAVVFWTSTTNNAVMGRGFNNGAWGGPVNFGGVALDGPGASSRGANADVFVHGGDHAVYFMECSTSCSGWQGLGGGIQGSPASVSWDSNRIDVFVRGNDNALWQRSWNGAWSPQWISLGGVLTSSPTVTSTAVNRLTVAARGGDGAVWTQSFNGSSWSGWSSAGGQIKGAPALVAQSGNRIDLFVTGTDNRLYRSRNFGGFSLLGGTLTSGPAAALMPTGGGNGVIQIGVRGGDGKLYLGQKAFP
jgi:hypothetical protein